MNNEDRRKKFVIDQMSDEEVTAMYKKIMDFKRRHEKNERNKFISIVVASLISSVMLTYLYHQHKLNHPFLACIGFAIVIGIVHAAFWPKVQYDESDSGQQQ